MDLTAVILACAPFVSQDTMAGYIQQRSQADPLAIHITQTDRWIRPENQDDAIEAAKKLLANGIDIEAGLAQIKSADCRRVALALVNSVGYVLCRRDSGNGDNLV